MFIKSNNVATLQRYNAETGIKNGFSMVELLIAVAVVTLVLVAVALGVSVSVKNTRYSSERFEAARLAKEAIEWSRASRDSLNWRQFSDILNADGAGVVRYCLTTLPETNDDFISLTASGDCVASPLINNLYQREIRFDTTNLAATPANVSVQVEVNWVDGQEDRSVSLQTQLYQWR